MRNQEHLYNEFNVQEFEKKTVEDQETGEERTFYVKKWVNTIRGKIGIPTPIEETMSPTKRGFVKITDDEATHNNSHALRRKIFYVKAEEGTSDNQEELELIRKEYLEIVGTEVPNNKKNNTDWMKKKVEEIKNK